MSPNNPNLRSRRYADFQACSALALAGTILPGEAAYLFWAVDRLESNDWYHATRASNGYFIVGSNTLRDALVLNAGERRLMLAHVRDIYMEGMDPDSFLAVSSALTKPNP